MITELKRTPITWNGEDGWEVLVRDTDPANYDICELCIYRDWYEGVTDDAYCEIVHGCLILPFTYFIFKHS